MKFLIIIINMFILPIKTFQIINMIQSYFKPTDLMIMNSDLTLNGDLVRIVTMSNVTLRDVMDFKVTSDRGVVVFEEEGQSQVDIYFYRVLEYCWLISNY